jgi:hypothetical protein
MTTTVYYAGEIGTTQNLYTISYPSVNLFQNDIANVSKATTAVVTSKSSLPVGFVSGEAVTITNVGGMTELLTSGENGSNKYYANVISPTTFGLFSDSGLTANVDSTSFTSAVANTGSYQTFTVSQYNSVQSPATVVFDTGTISSGSQIQLDETTGVITFQGGSDYTLSAVVNTNRTFPQTSTAGYQWYNATTDEAFGPFVKFGETCTAILSIGDDTDVVLKVYSDTGTFEYPNQLFDANFTAQLIVPV